LADFFFSATEFIRVYFCGRSLTSFRGAKIYQIFKQFFQSPAGLYYFFVLSLTFNPMGQVVYKR
jgi:hypothetical protein